MDTLDHSGGVLRIDLVFIDLLFVLQNLIGIDLIFELIKLLLLVDHVLSKLDQVTFNSCYSFLKFGRWLLIVDVLVGWVLIRWVVYLFDAMMLEFTALPLFDGWKSLIGLDCQVSFGTRRLLMYRQGHAQLLRSLIVSRRFYGLLIWSKWSNTVTRFMCVNLLPSIIFPVHGLIVLSDQVRFIHVPVGLLFIVWGKGIVRHLRFDFCLNLEIFLPEFFESLSFFKVDLIWLCAKVSCLVGHAIV